MTIRYGARPPDQQRNREIEATSTKIWSTAVTVVWETDADAIRAVLPPPLEPSEPRARIRFATVDMGTGIPVFGAGWFGVRARHGSVEGEYALFMPMTTEQATVGGRETYGEPKKIGGVSIERSGDHAARASSAWASSWRNSTEYSARRSTYLLATRSTSTSRSARRPTARASTPSPRSYVRRHEEARDGRTIDGTLTLHDSPIDPIADIPVGRILSMQFAQVATTQEGEVVERVPADWLLPYVHQRYDDLSVLGKSEGQEVSDPYTIISADAHAGLPCEEYRPYLDSATSRSSTPSSRSARRTATSRWC